jgi:hypothetical protein
MSGRDAAGPSSFEASATLRRLRMTVLVASGNNLVAVVFPPKTA